jgi:flagellar basal-body rod modification protein FlgD
MLQTVAGNDVARNPLSMSKAATQNGAAKNAAPSSAASDAAAANESAAAATQEASDRFLTLLVTQLRNQDPLNPLDNAQITTQLAQISTVSGINKLNDTVASLSASMAAGQYLQAISLVGRDVVVAGDKMTLADGKAPYGMAIAKDADTVTVTIKDAGGVVVRTIDLGAQKSGIHTFEWNGMDGAGKAMAEGTYTMSVTATASGEAVATDALTIAKVGGVSPTAQGTMLSLGSLGTIALAEILQIN